jgi:hypothetical protein
MSYSSSNKRTRQVTLSDLLPRSRVVQRLRNRNARLYRECASHVANLQSQAVLRKHLRRTRTHEIFDVGDIIDLILEYQPSRDVYFFFDKLVSEYSSLILHPDNRSRRIDHEIEFPYPVPVLTHCWSDESFHLVVDEIENNWVEKRFIPQRCCDEHALSPFCHVVVTVVLKAWSQLFLSVSQLCADEPDSSETYAQLLILIARTSFIAKCEATHLTMDRISSFGAFSNSLTQYHMDTAPRGVQDPDVKSELGRVVRSLYPELSGTCSQTTVEIFRRMRIAEYMKRAMMYDCDICNARRKLQSEYPLEHEAACSQNFIFCPNRPLRNTKLTPYKNLSEPVFSEQCSYVFERDGTAVPSTGEY